MMPCTECPETRSKRHTSMDKTGNTFEDGTNKHIKKKEIHQISFAQRAIKFAVWMEVVVWNDGKCDGICLLSVFVLFVPHWQWSSFECQCLAPSPSLATINEKRSQFIFLLSNL